MELQSEGMSGVIGGVGEELGRDEGGVGGHLTDCGGQVPVGEGGAGEVQALARALRLPAGQEVQSMLVRDHGAKGGTHDGFRSWRRTLRHQAPARPGAVYVPDTAGSSLCRAASSVVPWTGNNPVVAVTSKILRAPAGTASRSGWSARRRHQRPHPGGRRGTPGGRQPHGAGDLAVRAFRIVNNPTRLARLKCQWRVAQFLASLGAVSR
ncbi:hypothetical protein GCM10009663_52880 [Kitasatospora arboriphila]|uniref:Transposase IS701-like DDE domain-containing protein n=1 Tax=Kitasatospora arboriphila TaxID=258052 RepID=A0ABN1TUU8_9ACTN